MPQATVGKTQEVLLTLTHMGSYRAGNSASQSHSHLPSSLPHLKIQISVSQRPTTLPPLPTPLAFNPRGPVSLPRWWSPPSYDAELSLARLIFHPTLQPAAQCTCRRPFGLSSAELACMTHVLSFYLSCPMGSVGAGCLHLREQ